MVTNRVVPWSMLSKEPIHIHQDKTRTRTGSLPFPLLIASSTQRHSAGGNFSGFALIGRVYTGEPPKLDQAIYTFGGIQSVSVTSGDRRAPHRLRLCGIVPSVRRLQASPVLLASEPMRSQRAVNPQRRETPEYYVSEMARGDSTQLA